jgi:hypothetical protein
MHDKIFSIFLCERYYLIAWFRITPVNTRMFLCSFFAIRYYIKVNIYLSPGFINTSGNTKLAIFLGVTFE